MWWGMQRQGQQDDLSAIGNKGQFIYISPEKNLIILRYGETYGDYGDAQGWVELFYDFASEW
jgi:CubicO group peptidase (beta-lactamase class C family)